LLVATPDHSTPGAQEGHRARGAKGEEGAKGDSPEIVGWHLDRKTYRAFLVLADGTLGSELNLRPLFEQFVEETSRVVE
jgi:hypothetical protein